MKNQLLSNQRNQIIKLLKERFEKNMQCHQGMEWDKLRAKLEDYPEKLWSLNEMEITGCEPDLVGYDENSKEYIFYDCAAESPQGRRSICYDREALAARKENKPKYNAVDMAVAMGIEILTENQYRELQQLGKFDTKTSSWVSTPAEIRNLGGAIFCDFRYNKVFVYHNGAESYYAGRRFRGRLKV